MSGTMMPTMCQIFVVTRDPVTQLNLKSCIVLFMSVRRHVAILELEFYLFDRQLHNIGEIISKYEIILPGDSDKGTNWPLS